MSNRWNVSVVAVAILAVFTSACSGANTKQVVNKKVQLQFVTHLEAAMPEQDVFVEVAPGSTEVYRITMADRTAFENAPVYGSQEFILHDPFQVGYNPVGPYPKGALLGLTMGEWLAGTGTGTYSTTGSEAWIDLSLENLVPNGVYTIECASINVPPNFSYIDEPCGVGASTQNTVIADTEGKADVHLAVKALPDSTAETVQLIAATYHSDGLVYGGYPGDYGLNSHVHILAFIPMPEDTAWQILSNDSSVAQR
jgi:hypothetical protein